jgi:hypothetical protein
MKVEFNLGTSENFTIGVTKMMGEDEHGVFSMLVFGIGFFEFCFINYNI